MLIGYARVSTGDQNLDLQIQALQQLGCKKIYTDRGYPVPPVRAGLDRALARIKLGDVLVVWRLDRLGRSLPHLVCLLETLERRSVAFHSATEHIDTRSSGGQLVFHMMAALAEFERALISERTQAGVAAARARGKRMAGIPCCRLPRSAPPGASSSKAHAASAKWPKNLPSILGPCNSPSSRRATKTQQLYRPTTPDS